MEKYTFLLVFVIACACETLRDIEIEREPDKLVLYGSFHSDSVVQITLSSSLFITDHIERDFSLKGANVNLYQSDEFIEQLMQVPSEYEIAYSTTYKSQGGFIPQVGKDYKIEIDASGYESVFAETTVPSKIDITDIEFNPNEVPINSDYSGYPVSIQFEDDDDEINYYILAGYTRTYEQTTYDYGGGHVEVRKDTIDRELMIMPRAYRDLGLGSEDPFKQQIYFSSEDLTGGEVKKIDCYVSIGFGHQIRLGKTIYPEGYEPNEFTVTVFAKLTHITKAQYDYGRTVALQLEKGDDPFAEPVLIKSNVEGGLGIFAGYSETLSEEVTSDKIHYGE